MQWSGTTERDEREAPRVMSALDTHQSDRPGHTGIDDRQNALGGSFERQPEWLRDSHPDRPFRGRTVEFDFARQQGRRNPPEDQMRVGHGRLVRAAAVTGRARIGAGAARTDRQPAAAFDVRDAAATGADGVNVDHRQLEREIADLALARSDPARRPAPD